ncbi:cytochrome c oxidase assembly protein [Rhodococcus sp. X156]|uniref:cytochrome c oxidase assembly protein n=1 Tax=Rhodococcus sp. X156 TaxID=2499145 RepID=UPI000FDA87A3|nr:cytochrome c oxidase assembly protein [Rhodococcus sp. X156]
MASQDTSTPPTQCPGGVLLAAGVVAAVVAAALAALSTTEALSLLGLPDPGVLTTYGLPIVRAVGETSAVLAIGCILLAAFFVPPQRSGVLSVDGYRAMRVAAVAATVWCISALLLVPLTLSDTSGQPLKDALDPALMWDLVGEVEVTRAWAWTAGLAFLLAVGCRVVLRWHWTPALLALGLLTLVPLGLSGHSSAGGSHDVAANSLVFHLVAASLWAGGLVAVLLHGYHRGELADLAVRRFSKVALVCFGVMAVTGVINASVRLPLSDLFTTTYGVLVLAKAVALLALGVLGYLQRRHAVAALQADPTNRAPFLRLAAIEVVLLAATVGLAIGLSRTPPPQGGAVPTVSEVALGYNLPNPFSVQEMLTGWRFDLVYGTAALVLAGMYVWGVVRLRRRGDAWPVGRTVAWLLGCVALLFVSSSGLGKYAMASFSAHMSAHMVFSMLVPVLLVLGGPVTLALRALPTSPAGAPPGPREWLLTALHSRFSRIITHPVFALLMFVGSFYALYLGGLFDVLVPYHSAHVAMNAHFLISGYLFYWVAIGIDPAPRKLPSVAKLGMVFAALPFHAFFGVILMGSSTIVAAAHYRTLGLTWNSDLLGDQRLGGGIAWSAGEVPLMLVMVALLVQWSREDSRTAKRVDRVADRDDDAELEAHNNMFAELRRRDQEQQLH